MRVRLVTSWGTACGIAEHSAMLKEAVEAADPSIQVTPDVEALDPGRFVHSDNPPAIVHLNYQAALLSRWTPEILQRLRTIGYKVVVTYHDSGVPNSDQCKAIVDAADATVVHEPFDDLPDGKAIYWRMGVPDWQPPAPGLPDHRPLLGTIGFPVGYKNYDELCALTREIGWDLLLIAPGATVEQLAGWQQQHPDVIVRPDFVARHEGISLLSACDATVFFYTNAFAGQAGAIQIGLAARKPVLALATCRQFRALFGDTLGRTAITWVETFDDLRFALTHFIHIQRCDPGIVALAEQESWTKLGRKYARLYKELVR
jgi:hypothetical protein